MDDDVREPLHSRIVGEILSDHFRGIDLTAVKKALLNDPRIQVNLRTDLFSENKVKAAHSAWTNASRETHGYALVREMLKAAWEAE